MIILKNKKFWEFKNIVPNKSADLYIYSEISTWEDDVSSNSFKNDLDGIGEISNLNLYINSCGGSVAEGLAIGNMIKRSKAYVTGYVDSMACSIASVIACSCDKLVMPRNSLLMVHNASTCCWGGNAQDFRKVADDLDKITESIRQTYLEKSPSLSEDRIKEIMDAETWLTAQESYDLGLCDEIIEANKSVAKVDRDIMKNYVNIPENIKELLNKEDNKVEDDNLKDPAIDNQDDSQVVDNTQDDNELNDGVIEDNKEENVEDTCKKKKNDSNEDIENLTLKVLDQAETISNLNTTIASMKEIVDEYNAKRQSELEEENKAKLKEKQAYYTNKFNALGGKDKLDSEEVKNLLKDCISKESQNELNQILLDLVSDEKQENKKTIRIENIFEVEDLIECEDGASKFGFR